MIMGKIYCLIESGSIVASNPSQLPDVYKNISNFYALEYDSPERLRDLSWSGNPYQGFYEASVTTMPTCSVYYDIVSSFDVNPINYTVTQSFSTSPVSQQLVDGRNEQLWNQIREIRTNYLKNTDWTQLPDVGMPSEKVQEYVVFRQQLRSITDNFSDPSQVVWPTIPTSSSLDPFPQVPRYSC
jgi:hypothetical protein